VDPTGHAARTINIDGGTGGAPEGKSCEDYGKSGDVKEFIAVCVGNGTGNYAAVEVTTFIPDKVFRDLFGIPGYGDGRDLFEPGTHRTDQVVLLDVRSGSILSNTTHASPSHTPLRDFPAPSTASMQASSQKLPTGEAVVNLNANIASKGLSIGDWSPLDISYSFDFYISPNGGAPVFYGAHDGFPAYEISVFTAATYQVGYHPRRNHQTLWSLGGLTEWYMQYPNPSPGYECFGAAVCH
jgi:hypothetical protein